MPSTSEVHEARERFVAYFTDTNNPDDQNAKRAITAANTEIERLEAEYRAVAESWMFKRKKRRKLGAISTKLVRLRGETKNLISMLGETQLAEAYDRILTIPRVSTVTIEENMMLTYTDELFGKDMNFIWHRVGAFKIRFDLRNLSQAGVRWINLTCPREDMQGPPNIGKDGSVGCLGDARDPLVTALEKNDWETAVAVAIRYPECAGARNNIRNWPVVSDDQVPKWYLEVFGRTGVSGPVPTNDSAQDVHGYD